MASNLPIPLPPRTPTPPADDPLNGPDHTGGFRAAHHDQDSLSPLVDTFPPQRSPLDTEDRNRLSPTRAAFNLNPSDTTAQNGPSESTASGPFNFKPMTMAKSPVVKSVR